MPPKDTITGSVSTTVHEASRLMERNNIGALPIVDEARHVVGIFTERDILRKVVSASLDPATTLLGDVMTSDPIVFSSDEPMLRVFQTMKERRFRHAPIVDRENRLVKVVSLSDFDMPFESIMVVEDNRLFRAMLRDFLAGQGYHLRFMDTAEAAKDFLEKSPEEFSAIILDWELPGMNGLELLQWIRTHEPLRFTPVIMQTGRRDASDIKQGIAAGAWYYLTKPLNPELLRSIVNAAVLDYREKTALMKRLRESETHAPMLRLAAFAFQTPQEGETLALKLANECPDPVKAMNLSEIFINAVEHGNLGITYEEKGRFIEERTWSTEVKKRLLLPENEKKTVKVRVRRYEERMIVNVEDCGKGFDWKPFLTLTEERVFDNHGRGIAMAAADMSLEYLGSGNRVIATVRFS